MAHSKDDEPTRRDFLYIATGMFAGLGVAGVAWPFIDQMNPDASAKALASIEVDVKDLKPGQLMTVLWRGKPVFIRHRTEEEVKRARQARAKDLKDGNEFKDPDARNAMQPPGTLAVDENRTLPGKEDWLVLIGVCTHLGCIPKDQWLGNEGNSDFEGWFCPCHGSHYDISGRIRKGPAPRNLAVPKYAFISDTVIKIG